MHTLVYKLKLQTFRVCQKRVQNQYCVIKEKYTRGCVNCTFHTERCVHMIGDGSRCVPVVVNVTLINRIGAPGTRSSCSG